MVRVEIGGLFALRVKVDYLARRAVFSVGELATFSSEPRWLSDNGPAGRWRMELGARWHREIQALPPSAGANADSEKPVCGEIAHRGWVFKLEGRLDQWLESAGGGLLLREIKTTVDRLPVDEDWLRAERPAWFVQLGLYLRLVELSLSGAVGLGGSVLSGELLLVEAGTGLRQTVRFAEADWGLVEAHLERTADFLEARRAAMERLRALRWRPAFAERRPGQETIVEELFAALAPGRPVVLAAPTGFGKTGVLLETAFAALRDGRVERVVYLTGKSTGQLHVADTLAAMLGDSPEGLSVWQVRPRREHCVNDVFHCTRERCRFLNDLTRRYREAGLARFHLFPGQDRGLPALRAAGLEAGVCPYEITRAALPWCPVWIGDFNYLFAQASRGLFVERPTWDPARTLLLIDEGHQLPARAAEARSYVLEAEGLHALLAEVEEVASAPLRRALAELWRRVVDQPAAEALDLDAEEDLVAGLRVVVEALARRPVDPAGLSPYAAEQLYALPTLLGWLETTDEDRLVWSRRAGEISFTCLDASDFIGETLGPFAAVVLATATPPPREVFAAELGIGAGDLRELRPGAPWRAGAYEVAVDLRVDTTFRRRQVFLGKTVATLVALRRASPGAPVAAFFPSFVYAEAVAAAVEREHPELRCARQPRGLALAELDAWIERELVLADVLFFVLGGVFAEGVDHLGGRITHALVAGPALPEVNAVQRAREAAEVRRWGAAEAFRRVYVVPGLQKVNQALGRLVRSPGQRCRVILHCRRFAETAYASLLEPEYQFGRHLLDDADLIDWLGGP